MQAHTDLARHGLILVLDGPQDADVIAAVQGCIAARVLHNEMRGGFVAAVNRGMQVSKRDVILLNSDTIVSANWLEKMQAALNSRARIGTVTPLSNNAALCSVPRGFNDNRLPIGFDLENFASLVEKVSERRYLSIPTAVGMCMLIRRQLIDEIGYFDQTNFGMGYGEENDFCLRASAAGWLHVADDATFIYHRGNRSFKTERKAQQRQSMRTLRRLHPNFFPLIARFIADDPLQNIRTRIANQIRLQKQKSIIAPTRVERKVKKVVHLVHGWLPDAVGGTEFYAHWLVQKQLDWREVSVYARLEDTQRDQYESLEVNDHGARVRLLVNNFIQRNPLARNSIHSSTINRDFEKFLREEKPDLIHIHHLIGHALSLMQVAKKLKVPVVMQIQDWFALCGRVNFTDRDGDRCNGAAIGKCANCITMTKIRPAPVWNRALQLVRKHQMKKTLALADAYVMGSNAICADYRAAELFAPNRPVFVLPYGVDLAAQNRPTKPSVTPLRFGFIGSALPYKGLHIARRAFEGIDPALAELKLFGYAGTRFVEAEKAQVFAQMDILLLPSIGLESFGLVAREAHACGVPVIASDEGALRELQAIHFPSGDWAALREVVLRLARTPSLVDDLIKQIVPPKTAGQHALEIEDVYSNVLANFCQ